MTERKAEVYQTIRLQCLSMCGRAYKTYTEEELYFQYLSKRPLNLIGFEPVYNLCPTQTTLVLRIADGERLFEEMRWQLVPNFEPAFSTKLSTINVKSETVFESPLFGPLVVQQRCIVPISGFFEWKTDGQKKRPFKIHLQSNAIMSVAGIWGTWRPGKPDERRSFSIMTTAANRFMREIQDRMPVILDNTAVADWLDPEIHERKALQEILQPCPNEWLSAVEVSPLVNSTRNNTPDVLQPASLMPPGPQGRLFPV
jgi:putative SOS response-associated peptidase YedK